MYNKAVLVEIKYYMLFTSKMSIFTVFTAQERNSKYMPGLS